MILRHIALDGVMMCGDGIRYKQFRLDKRFGIQPPQVCLDCVGDDAIGAAIPPRWNLCALNCEK